MITGFNTDIEFEGQVFHVQTEDKGRANPIIETLVYTGGQIVCARKTPYSELVASGDYAERVVLQKMELQHQELIRDIREGVLTKEDLQPFGGNIISNRSFDEVVRSYLAERVPLEQLRLDIVEPDKLRAGHAETLRLAVFEETTERPVGGVRVVAKLVRRDGEAIPLFIGLTDAAGQASGTLEIPGRPGADAAVVCEAEAAGKHAELRCPIGRRPRASVSRA